MVSPRGTGDEGGGEGGGEAVGEAVGEEERRGGGGKGDELTE